MIFRIHALIAAAAVLVSVPAWAQETPMGTTAITQEAQSSYYIEQALYDGGFYALEDLDQELEERTAAAVKRFQETWDMEPDGEMDHELVDRMIEVGLLKEDDLPLVSYAFSRTTYMEGNRHMDVTAIQRAMVNGGYMEKPEDGYTITFGANTKAAIQAFQEEKGLDVDGIVGPNTLAALAEHGLTKIVKDIPVSRGGSRAQIGEYLNWFRDVKGKIIDRGTEVHIKDIYSGLEYDVMMTYGANHADVEALTLEDTKVIKEILGGSFSWERRPVLVYVNGRVLAGSMSAMPHAGIDSKPAEAWVSNRSVGFGTGYNLDKIKNNGMDGVMDLHFAGSRRHMDNRQDSRHQAAVRVAAGLE